MATSRDIKVVLTLQDNGFTETARAAGVSMEQLKKSLQDTAAGFGTLDAAAAKSATVAKDSATASIQYRQKQVKAEAEAAQEQIRIQDDLHRKYTQAENNFVTQSIAASERADQIRRAKQAASGPRSAEQDQIAAKFQQSAQIARQEADAAALRSTALRVELQQRQQYLSSLDAEMAAAQKLAQQRAMEAYVGKANADTIARLRAQNLADDKASRRAEVEANRVAKAESLALSRAALAEEKAMMAERAAMMKGLAGLYVGSKVEKGLAGSVSAASRMQSGMLQVKGLNLPESQESEFVVKATELANGLKMISILDGIESRMSAISSIGENNVKIIDETLGTATKVALNLEALGYATKDGRQGLIKNLFGGVEQRGLTQDPEGAKNYMAMVQQAAIATHGKVTAKDLDNAMRRSGQFASTLDDSAIRDLVSAIDVMKTAGGDGGGGASGVSTVGVNLRALLSYVMGKGMSKNAVQEFAGLGVLNTDAMNIDWTKSSSKIFGSVKNAGLKDEQRWLANPFEMIREIGPAIIDFTKQHAKEFYQPGADLNSDEAQMAAVQKFFTKLGFASSATSMFVNTMSPKMAARAKAQNETQKNSLGPDEMFEEQKKTFDGQKRVFQADMENLGTHIGATLLPALTECLKVLNSFLESADEFVQNHPIATQFIAIAAAAAGVALVVGPLVALFGMSGLGAAFTAIGGWLTTIGAGFLELIPTFTGFFTTLEAGIVGFGADLLASFPIIESFGLFWGGVIASVAEVLLVGAGVGIAGWAGYMIGGWIKDIDIGGLTIQQHLENRFNELVASLTNIFIGMERAWDSTVNYFTKRWIEFKAAIGVGSLNDKVSADESAAERARMRNAEQAAADQQFKDLQLKPAPGSYAKAGDEKRFSATKDPRTFANRAKAGDPYEDLHPPEPKAPKPHLGGANNARIAGLDPNGTGNKKGKKDPKPREDPLNAALTRAMGEVDDQQLKLNALLKGSETLDDLKEEAATKILAQLDAGKFDPQGDASQRPSGDDPRIQSLIKEEQARLQLTEQIKAMTFANERMAASQVEADDSMQRLNGNAEKQSDAFRALERDFARAEQRLGSGAKGWAAWEAAKSKALYLRSAADYTNLSVDTDKKNKTDAIQYLPTQDARTDATITEEERKTREAYEHNRALMQQQKDDAIRGQNELLASFTGTADQRVAIEKKTAETITQIQADFDTRFVFGEQARTKQLELEAEKRTRAFEQPITALARQWKDTTQQLNSLQDGWANGFIDALFKGKQGIKDFALSVITDIAKVKMKETLADPLNNIITSGTDWLKKNLFNAGPNVAGATPAMGPSTGDVARFDHLSEAADKATDSFTSFTKDGLDEGTKSMVDQLSKDGMQASATTAATTSMGSLATAATAAAGALSALGATGGVGGLGGLGGLLGGASDAFSGGGTLADAFASGVIPMANGGIMSSLGSLPLRKYSSGGVATSPQLALYAEAGMNEAYVPLPDGRTIPVTMKGGGNDAGAQAPAVTVNVINQSGQSLSAQQGPVHFDGKRAILDVIVSAANQPGPFRDSMKNALK